MRPYTHKQPTTCRRFSWGRIPHESGCTWRLFRRDIDGRVYMSGLDFRAGTSRAVIAGDLLKARHRLRDRVDEIDLAALGLAA